MSTVEETRQGGAGPAGTAGDGQARGADEVAAHAARLDSAMARIAALEESARTPFADAKEALDALHKAGLTTIVRRLRDDDRGRELLYELVDEPGVRMLLAMHGIIRPDPITLATSAIDRMRPEVEDAGGRVELVTLAEGVATVRLEGVGSGCSPTAGRLRERVEQELHAAVPGLSRVELARARPEPTLIPLDQIRVRARGGHDVEQGLREQGWTAVLTADEISGGEVRSVTVDDGGREVSLVVVNRSGECTAFVNECAHQGLPLDDGLLDEEAGTLTCPWHGLCYDVSDGECLTLTGGRLEQVDCQVAAGQVWVRPEGR
ncbi:NifU family protein [Marihabitans asiaticum]|uniref:Nitrite reductase/ring-hydroxylating ferredoxin subunit n=1 Tax=Marihabitans asiaticum TaxID=415218 RepID=A0A560WGQ2_9MICO|nr:Rieske 2Fe-2S domain-containing protein [Marihabitans asiaticum]TWD16665.1 nitrite reductase/ring-hydroxylating ferredoxin subunit [Marihabitans asiaticum]